MKILIIGGTGFIGPYVVRHLHAAGHEVTVYHRGKTEADLPAEVAHMRGGWVAELPERRAELQRLAPDVVLYMLPIGAEDARMVMEACLGLAGRVAGISSGDVYRAYGRFHGSEPGPLEPVPLAADAPLRGKLYPYRESFAGQPEHPLYNYDKILAEREMMGRPELPGTILRLPFVYGPGDKQHRFYGYVKRMADGRPAIILGEEQARWRATYGYVENVAAAIAAAVTEDRAAGRIYNVGEETAVTEADRIRRLGQVYGWQGEVVAVPAARLPTHLSLAANWDQHMVTDTGAIRQELGHLGLVAEKDALQRTIEWELAHPPQNDLQQFDYAAEDAILSGDK